MLKAKSINISSFTDMQLNVDGEYGGKLPANFLNLEQHIEIFTPKDVFNEELLEIIQYLILRQISNEIITTFDIKFKVRNATHYIPNLFVCRRKNWKTFKKNDVKTGRLLI